MGTSTEKPVRLSDLPLWRLLIMLDDAERWGQTSQVRVLARVIQDKLRGARRG